MKAPVSLVVENLIHALIARRHALGLSQNALGRKLGFSRSQISEWESMEHLPSVPCLIMWARELDMFVRFIPFEGRKRRSPSKRPIELRRAA